MAATMVYAFCPGLGALGLGPRESVVSFIAVVGS